MASNEKWSPNPERTSEHEALEAPRGTERRGTTMLNLETMTIRASDHMHCECGEVIGESCQWSGPKSSTVVVEYMPEHLRASHEAAGNRGVYPHNGARRIRVERSCADHLLEVEDGWASVVG